MKVTTALISAAAATAITAGGIATGILIASAPATQLNPGVTSEQIVASKPIPKKDRRPLGRMKSSPRGGWGGGGSW